MTEPLAALNATKDKFWEFGAMEAPVCPHCKHVFGISENEAWFLYDDQSSHDVECPSCDLSYRVESHASWSFSTDDQTE